MMEYETLLVYMRDMQTELVYKAPTERSSHYREACQEHSAQVV